MKTNSKTFRIIIICVIPAFVMVCFCTLSFANDNDVPLFFSDTVFTESFEKQFPPDGWENQPGDSQNGWQQVEISPDGSFTTPLGDKFACTSSSDQPYTEIVLSTETYDISSEYGDIHHGDTTLRFYLKGTDEPYHEDFSIKITSGTEEMQRKIGTDYPNTDVNCQDYQGGWSVCATGFSAKVTPLSVSFIFNVSDQSFVCIDYITLDYEYWVHPEKDDDSNDDDGCGCSLSGSKTSNFVPLIMFAIAGFALYLSRLRRRT